MKRILINSIYKNQIAKEFDCSLVTVEMAFKYVTNSELAQKIRKRAQSFLEDEIFNIIIDIKNPHEYNEFPHFDEPTAKKPQKINYERTN